MGETKRGVYLELSSLESMFLAEWVTAFSLTRPHEVPAAAVTALIFEHLDGRAANKDAGQMHMQTQMQMQCRCNVPPGLQQETRRGERRRGGVVLLRRVPWSESIPPACGSLVLQAAALACGQDRLAEA